jgi:hypothetical protein
MAKTNSVLFLQALVAAGVLSGDTSNITRVIIDARVGQPLLVHVEHIGDNRLLDTVPALREVLGLS